MREPVWIAEREALAIHSRLLALEGGPAGVRDAQLLESALARPRQLLAYGQSPDIVDLAAAYTTGIVRNHPLVDGNKRTGFVVGILFLELNGHRFRATEESAAQAVLDLAAGRLDESAFGAWLRTNARRR
ncbi:MAG: type II toxin-antitoxin system death-on-curing family toxin [Candidatus Acidiferrales bacterium]